MANWWDKYPKAGGAAVAEPEGLRVPVKQQDKWWEAYPKTKLGNVPIEPLPVEQQPLPTPVQTQIIPKAVPEPAPIPEPLPDTSWADDMKGTIEDSSEEAVVEQFEKTGYGPDPKPRIEAKPIKTSLGGAEVEVDPNTPTLSKRDRALLKSGKTSVRIKQKATEYARERLLAGKTLIPSKGEDTPQGQQTQMFRMMGALSINEDGGMPKVIQMMEEKTGAKLSEEQLAQVERHRRIHEIAMKHHLSPSSVWQEEDVRAMGWRDNKELDRALMLYRSTYKNPQAYKSAAAAVAAGKAIEGGVLSANLQIILNNNMSNLEGLMWGSIARAIGGEAVVQRSSEGEKMNIANRDSAAYEAAAPEGWWGRQIRGMATTLPLMVAGGAVAGPGGAIVPAVGMQAGQSSTEGYDAGLRGEKLERFAGKQAVAEFVPAALMSAIGLGGVESFFGAGAKKAVNEGLKNWLKRMGIQLGAELGEEEFTSVWQAWNQLDIDPGSMDRDRMVDTLIDTAAQVFLTFGAVGSPSAVRTAMANATPSARDTAQAKQEFMDALEKAAAEVEKQQAVSAMDDLTSAIAEDDGIPSRTEAKEMEYTEEEAKSKETRKKAFDEQQAAREADVEGMLKDVTKPKKTGMTVEDMQKKINEVLGNEEVFTPEEADAAQDELIDAGEETGLTVEETIALIDQAMEAEEEVAVEEEPAKPEAEPQKPEQKESITVYRGEHAPIRGKQQLSNIQDVGHLQGLEGESPAPFEFFTTDQEDAKRYLSRDKALLDRYEKDNPGEGESVFETLHGHKPRLSGGTLRTEEIQPKQTLDLTGYGEIMDQFAMIELVNRAQGLPELPDKFNWKDVPESVIEEMERYGFFTAGGKAANEDGEFPVWSLFRHPHDTVGATLRKRGLNKTTAEDIGGHLFAQWLQDHGYDSVQHLHGTKTGPVTHLVMLRPDLMKSRWEPTGDVNKSFRETKPEAKPPSKGLKPKPEPVDRIMEAADAHNAAENLETDDFGEPVEDYNTANAEFETYKDTIHQEIKRLADKHGWETGIQYDSTSTYIDVDKYDSELETVGSFQVRISNHKQRHGGPAWSFDPTDTAEKVAMGLAEIEGEMQQVSEKASAPEAVPKKPDVQVDLLGDKIEPAKPEPAEPEPTEPDTQKDLFNKKGLLGQRDFIEEAEDVASGDRSDTSVVSEIPTIEIPLNELTLSTDVPNFKEGADPSTGVVEALQGKYERRGVAPIVVWERTSGKKEVVTGRHRLDLARRTGEKSIPSQIVREADGWTKEMAATLDAEANIRDDQGSTKDYVNYFKNSKITKEEASSRGLLSKNKGRQGFYIGRYGSASLLADFSSGRISAEKAAAVAEIARDDEGLQVAGLAQARKPGSAEEVRQFMRVLKEFPRDSSTETQGNLFGDDDSVIIEAQKIGKAVAEIIEDMKERKLVVAKFLSKPKAAKKMGLKGDRESIKAEVARINEALDEWSRWTTNPKLVNEAREKAGLPPRPSGGKGEASKPKGKRPSGNAMASLTEGDSYQPVQPEKESQPQGKQTPPPTASQTAVDVKGIVADLVGMASPAHVSDVSREAGHIMRKEMARAAQWDEASREALRKAEGKFWLMSPEDSYKFIDLSEAGKHQQQATPELVAISEAMAKEMQKGTARLQALGKLQDFYENYFPHMWQNPTHSGDIVRSISSGKPWRESGFLKQRTHITHKEGRDAGLIPITDNPVETILLRLHQVNKYVARTNMMEELKQSGLMKFVPESLDKSYMPSGYEYYDDPAFRVVTDPSITTKEAYDKLLVDQLSAVLNRLGVNHERVAKLSGDKWGVSEQGRRGIKTRFAGPTSVLAHELGHQIGEIWGLYGYLTKGAPVEGRKFKTGTKAGQEVKADAQRKRTQIQRELRALADLRAEGFTEEAAEGSKPYRRKRAEKEAVILEAWLAAPEKMAEVAPMVTEAWKQFLEANEPLSPILNLDRSVVLGTREQVLQQAGVLHLGKWAMPSDVARMVKNMLSPGLRSNPNQTVKGTYKLARIMGNAMNQASLLLSYFHGLNVLTDATASQIGLGLQQAERGKLGRSLWNIVTSPSAGTIGTVRGGRLIKAMRSDISSLSPEMQQFTKDALAAGARASMDPVYHNYAIRGIAKSIRKLRYGSAVQKLDATVRLPVQSILGALEMTAKPVLEWMVPRMKLSVFYSMAQDIHNRAAGEELSDFQVYELLSQAWDSVDNRLGQLSYDNLFWNMYLKDTSMLAVRSVGWNLGSFREYGGAVLDVANTKARLRRGDQLISRKMGYAVGAVMTYAPLGALLMYAFTGDWPEELKDYFFPRTGRTNRDGSPERLSLPTYAKDWVAWSTQPTKVALHKMHPMWGTMGDMFTNENYYGVKIRQEDDPWYVQLEDTMKHVAESFVPFSIKNMARFLSAGEDPLVAVPMALSGISSAPAYISRSPAQKLAYSLMVGNMPTGSRTREQADASQDRKELVRRLRGGETATDEEIKRYSEKQMKLMEKEAKKTSFQVLVGRLHDDQAMKVWNLASDEEKSQVRKTLKFKFINKASNPDADTTNEINDVKQSRMYLGQLGVSTFTDSMTLLVKYFRRPDSKGKLGTEMNKATTTIPKDKKPKYTERAEALAKLYGASDPEKAVKAFHKSQEYLGIEK